MAELVKKIMFSLEEVETVHTELIIIIMCKYLCIADALVFIRHLVVWCPVYKCLLCMCAVCGWSKWMYWCKPFTFYVRNARLVGKQTKLLHICFKVSDQTVVWNPIWFRCSTWTQVHNIKIYIANGFCRFLLLFTFARYISSQNFRITESIPCQAHDWINRKAKNRELNATFNGRFASILHFYSFIKTKYSSLEPMLRIVKFNWNLGPLS